MANVNVSSSKIKFFSNVEENDMDNVLFQQDGEVLRQMFRDDLLLKTRNGNRPINFNAHRRRPGSKHSSYSTA